MNLYIESSAVLAWLLGEQAGRAVRRTLRSATVAVSSDLTLVECDRVLTRGVATAVLSEGTAAELRSHLAAAANTWHTLHLVPEVIERARRPFPEEPIRTLDALHVAAALYARTAVADLAFLSLDDRIRRVARALGFYLQPE